MAIQHNTATKRRDMEPLPCARIPTYPAAGG